MASEEIFKLSEENGALIDSYNCGIFKDKATTNLIEQKNGLYEEETDRLLSFIYNDVYGKYYAKCKEIVTQIRSNQFSKFAEKSINEVFTSEHINKQTALMIECLETNPTESIGKAKELIESCCGTILEKNGIIIDKDWKLNNLVDETMKLLEMTPKHIPDTAKEATAIKAILGSLKGIASNIAIVRNAYGTGHGKTNSYKGLEPQHAKLAVGSSITLVNFLWDSYQRQLK